jgi:hypothetical protein
MKKQLFTGALAGIVALSMAGEASAFSLIDGTTKGFYNQAIGTSLNLTNPTSGTYLFPGDYQTYGDPTFNPVPFEPNLSAASSALGNWLTAPTALNANWNFQSIPATWQVNDETAIIYKINAGSTGLSNVVAKFGVDNGLFVWLDGTFKSGWLAPGGASPNEYTLSFSSLTAGDHYLQILREDHGGGTGFNINVTAELAAPVPEPETYAMMLAGLGLLGVMARRRKQKLNA